MTISAAIDLAIALQSAFATDAGAAAAMLARPDGLLDHERTAYRIIIGHPAYHAGRHSLRVRLEKSAAIFRTVDRVCAA